MLVIKYCRQKCERTKNDYNSASTNRPQIFENVASQAAPDDIMAQVRKSNNSLQHRESRLAKLVIITTIKTITTLLVTLHLNYLLQFRAIIIGTIA